MTYTSHTTFFGCSVSAGMKPAKQQTDNIATAIRVTLTIKKTTLPVVEYCHGQEDR